MRISLLIYKTLLSLFFVIGSFGIQLSGQCTFNCVDTLNVSVNNICTATITPAMVLKAFDPNANCNYAIELTDQNGNIINLDKTRADIGSQYVGTVLKVRIFEAGFINSGNSCWAYVNVEDKLPPDIVCVGNDTLECYRTDIFGDDASASAYLKSRIESQLIDNCGNEEVTVNITKNDLVQMLCLNEFAAMRIVGYNVLDNNNNVTSCEDTIYYERFILDSLDAPKNYVGSMSLSCNDPYPTVEYLIGIDNESPGQNSLPNIDGISIANLVDSFFVERGLCNFKMTYQDIIFETCGSTFKIVRNWMVIDWCNANFPINFNQVIKVLDESVSVGSISNLGPFATDPGLCDASVVLPFPVVSQNECSNWTYTILVQEPGDDFFIPYGGTRSSVPQEVTRRFPIGTSMVKYIVEDACFNTDEVEFNVTVVDEESPIPVCDFRTVVTLTDSFLGKAQARSFDDGSYDNCSGIVQYEVRRMDRFETDCPTPGDFADYVKFCCSDIGKIIMVELRVTDAYGNSAICMAEAMVQYKGPGPSITCQPDPDVRGCTSFDSFDISTLTPPSVSSSNPCIADGLVPLIREVDRSIDDCGDGFIDVEWYYNLTGDEEVICTNRITFSNPDPFDINDINWPSDRTVESCDDAPRTTEELENIINPNKPCGKAVVSDPSDRIFENIPGKCLKIIRTWTVVDWCRYPADPSARWTYEQTIDVINSQGPAIDISGSNLQLNLKSDSCRANMMIEGLGTDDCTPVDELVWTYQLDLLSDGQEIPLIPETNGRVLGRLLDAGIYVLTWTATDGCGNTTIARQNIAIDDNVAPDAICGFVVRDMDSTNIITVLASELDNGSSDNCGEELSILIRRAGDNSSPAESIEFTCADLGVNDVELWVMDNMGNQDMCPAQVDIRDGLSTCGFGASNLILRGDIRTPDNITLENARIALMMNGAEVQSMTTDIDGKFHFENLELNQSYSLESHKNDDYLNGISTLDLVLMQRHILGLQKIDSPYKLIAADINNSHSISAVDIVLLRRLILGHIDELPNNESWKFIDKSFRFTDPENPWNYPVSIELGPISESMTKEITAIKIGDLNANVAANSGIASSRRDHSKSLLTSIKMVQSNTVVFQVRSAEDIKAIGLQLEFVYDDQKLKFKTVRSPKMEIVRDMFRVQSGKISLSVAHAEERLIRDDDVLLEFIFEFRGDSQLNDQLIRLNYNPAFNNEIYTSDLTAFPVEVHKMEDFDDVVLYQNKPNPFDHRTFIEFDIPKEETVTFELFDINGSRVHSLSRRFSAGRNQIKIDREQLQLNKGIYYYQIHAQKRSLTMKMIIL